MKGYAGAWGRKKTTEGGWEEGKNVAIYDFFFFFLPRDIYVVGSLSISYELKM